MVTSRAIAEAVASAVRSAAVELRPDFLAALRHASASEPSERGRRVLDQLIANAEVAARDRVPLCQDTGSVPRSASAATCRPRSTMPSPGRTPRRRSA